MRRRRFLIFLLYRTTWWSWLYWRIADFYDRRYEPDLYAARLRRRTFQARLTQQARKP